MLCLSRSPKKQRERTSYCQTGPGRSLSNRGIRPVSLRWRIGDEYLLLVDSYSGFFNFSKLVETTSEATIEILKDWFSTHGIPKELHSDTGPQYNSVKFKEFCNVWKFKHITSSPKHPRSDGLAERYVQTAKNLLKKCNKDGSDLKLSLLMMRATPTENSPSPAERLFGRRIRTPITVAKVEVTTSPEEITSQLIQNRQRQKTFADRQSKAMPPLAVGDKVLVQEGPRKWFSGEALKEHEAPRSFVVKMNDGKLLRRNTSHLKKSNAVVQKPRNRFETMPQPVQAATVPRVPVVPVIPIEQQRIPEAEPSNNRHFRRGVTIGTQIWRGVHQIRAQSETTRAARFVKLRKEDVKY